MKKVLIIISLFAILFVSCNNHKRHHGKECDSTKVDTVQCDTVKADTLKK